MVKVQPHMYKLYVLKKELCNSKFEQESVKVNRFKCARCPYGSGSGWVAVMSDSFDPTDYGLARSSVHGIFQARTLECVAISFNRGSSQPKDQSCVSCIAGRFFTTEPPESLHGQGHPWAVEAQTVGYSWDGVSQTYWTKNPVALNSPGAMTHNWIHAVLHCQDHLTLGKHEANVSPWDFGTHSGHGTVSSNLLVFFLFTQVMESGWIISSCICKFIGKCLNHKKKVWRLILNSKSGHPETANVRNSIHSFLEAMTDQQDQPAVVINHGLFGQDAQWGIQSQ